MATASSKEVPRDGSLDFSAEEHAEALEEKHAVSLHEAGRLRPHPPVTPRKPIVKLASLRTSSLEASLRATVLGPVEPIDDFVIAVVAILRQRNGHRDRNCRGRTPCSFPDALLPFAEPG